MSSPRGWSGRRLAFTGVLTAFTVGALGGVWLGGRTGPSVSSRPIPTAAVPGAGPAEVTDGVPVGYARSAAGAAAAATGYLTAAAGLVGLPAAERAKAMRRMVAPSSAELLMAELNDALAPVDAALSDAVARGGGRAFMRTLPVAYRVEAYSPARARVTVWGVAVFVLEGVSAAEEAWATSDVQLEWSGGDWRVWSWTRTKGPQPGTRSPDATPTAEFLASLEGLEGYRYVPAA